jgi:hypothetical protein
MESFKFRGFEVVIEHDEFGEDPRTDDNVGVMVCVHGKYILGDKQFRDIEDMQNHMLSEDIAVQLPLYLYDHSGLTMSTTPFSCPWDSGQVGYIYATYERLQEEWPQFKNNPTVAMKESILNMLVQEVKTYDHYLRGEVYGYRIKSLADSNLIDCEDSCYGYYGDPKESGLVVDAKDAIMYATEKYKKEALELSRQRRKQKRKDAKFTLSEELQQALDVFKNVIRDEHGSPLLPIEVKRIKAEIDRLAEGYEGM